MRTKLRFIALAGLMATSAGIRLALAGPAPALLSAAAAEPATVDVHGDTIYYIGNFSQPSTQAFKASTDSLQRGQLKRMVISSVGGVTGDAREVANWVLDMALVVEVDAVCFSSCANYVFAAGKARIIRKDAFVGWHGNERGMAFAAQQKGTISRDELRKGLPPEMLDKPPEAVEVFIDQMLESAIASNQDEAAFYAKLGLSDAFAMCAVGDAALAKYPGLQDKQGWGFSIKDMNLLGLKDIRYLGKGSYERDSKYFKKYLELIRAKDCLSYLQ